MDRRRFCQAALVALMGPSANQALAGSPAPTVIVVDNMHCSTCARKIATRLYGVPGVIAVRTNVPANTATITPQQQRQPSPKALWEAVEKAGFKPLRLEGPQGKFEAKPRV